MPQTTKTQYPRRPGLELTFTEEDHRYFDNEGRDYVSVTTLVKSAFPKFDAQAAAKRVSLREGGGPHGVLAPWERIRDTPCRYGAQDHGNEAMKLIKAA